MAKVLGVGTGHTKVRKYSTYRPIIESVVRDAVEHHAHSDNILGDTQRFAPAQASARAWRTGRIVPEAADPGALAWATSQALRLHSLCNEHKAIANTQQRR